MGRQALVEPEYRCSQPKFLLQRATAAGKSLKHLEHLMHFHIAFRSNHNTHMQAPPALSVPPALLSWPWALPPTAEPPKQHLALLVVVPRQQPLARSMPLVIVRCGLAPVLQAILTMHYQATRRQILPSTQRPRSTLP